MTKNPLLILDLEGTTGIFSSNMHQNNMILLRHGFKEFLESKVWFDCVIATRAPRFYVDQISRNLKNVGLTLPEPIYSKEDVEMRDETLRNYKYIRTICSERNISNVASEVVIMGDFLRFFGNDLYSANDYLSHNFATDPSHLALTNSLNDHPYPVNGETPVYMILPQPWTTKDRHGIRITLSFNFALWILRKLWDLGAGNFSDGFRKLGNSNILEKVEVRAPNMRHNQKYLILKGESQDWKPMLQVF